MRAEIIFLFSVVTLSNRHTSDQQVKCLKLGSLACPAGGGHQTGLHLGAAAAAPGVPPPSSRWGVAPPLEGRGDPGGRRRLQRGGADPPAEAAQPAAGGAAEAAGRRGPLQGEREGPGPAGEAGPEHEGLSSENCFIK